MRSLKAILFLAVIGHGWLFSQSEDFYYRRIQRKLEADRSASNLFCIALLRDDFSSTGALRGTMVTYRGKDLMLNPPDSVGYEVFFLKGDEYNASDVIPVAILRTTTTGSAQSQGYMLTSGAMIQSEEEFVCSLEQFLERRSDADGLYARFASFIRSNPERQVQCLKKDGAIPRSGGGTSTDNKDLVNYSKIHANHLFVPFGTRDPKRRASREPDSSMTDYYLDVTFSSVSGSWKQFSSRSALYQMGLGFEAGFGDRTLNLLAYQAPYVSYGGRFLIAFSGNTQKLETQDFFELKILGRSRVNTGKLIRNLRLTNLQPFMSLEGPRLNVTPGLSLDLGFSRFDPKLPFVSLFYSHGSKAFSDPFATFAEQGKRKAFYSTNAWEATFSYYWNTDIAMANRFRLDIGAGSYKIWQVAYDDAGSVTDEDVVHGLSRAQPLIAVDYTHASNENQTVFGASIRFFDNRFTIVPWLKILRIDPHELRLESMYISPAVGRGAYPWETSGGSVLQLRYRFGFTTL